MIRPQAIIIWLLAAVAPIAGIADQTDDGDSRVSISDGVYRAEQAERGEFIYPSICGRCHGYRLDGAPDDPDMLPAPPIAGPKFLRKWNGASLAALYDYMRTSMPAINPGALSDSEYLDVLSYMLSVSRMPAGQDALRPRQDELARTTIEAAR